MIRTRDRSKIKDKKENYIYRILDANFNRASEGLRVVEEIARFILGDTSLVRSLKEVRHGLGETAKGLSPSLLEFREPEKDIGASLTIASEDRRENICSIALANFRRTQEAVRVLEEFGKLVDEKQASYFKRLRFKLYGLEKDVKGKLDEIGSVCHP